MEKVYKVSFISINRLYIHGELKILQGAKDMIFGSLEKQEDVELLQSSIKKAFTIT